MKIPDKSSRTEKNLISEDMPRLKIFAHPTNDLSGGTTIRGNTLVVLLHGDNWMPLVDSVASYKGGSMQSENRLIFKPVLQRV
jgi:hypothetical protein